MAIKQSYFIVSRKVSNILIFLCACVFLLNMISFFENMFRKKQESHLKKIVVTKNILYWNTFFRVKDFNFGIGSDPFHSHRCDASECFITNVRDWIPIEQFDAIVFHGPEFYPSKKEDLPLIRSPFQKYVYFSQESPANRPVYSILNGEFNITMTYRLDSDIHAPYFHISTLNDTIVAPSCDPKWLKPVIDDEYLKTFANIYNKKKKPVAWFASNCHSVNGREKLVKKLQENITVDVYGQCGPFKCPRSQESICFDILKHDYFFFLSFENSNCVDYVTEKVLNALNNDVVPIVLNGANMTRFLPPGSYIDASQLKVEDLITKLKYLMKNPSKYLEYFWWKKFYKIGLSPSPFCYLCEMLHDDNVKTKTYNIQEWWHGTKDKPVCR